MILYLHKDPMKAADLIEEKDLRLFIDLYVGYLIRALEGYEDEPNIRWLRHRVSNYNYLWLKTYYLIGRHAKIKPLPKRLDCLLFIEKHIQKGHGFKVSKLPKDGHTINKHGKTITEHRRFYNRYFKNP